MVRFRDAVACLLILSAVCGGFAFCLGRLTAPVVRVSGPQGERGIKGEPGRNGQNGTNGRDCDERRFAELEKQIKKLEAAQCRCKCR